MPDQRHVGHYGDRRLCLAVSSAVLGLAGCAALSANPHVHGGVNEVVVDGFDSRAEALPFAIARCHHFGRSAEYVGKKDRSFTFRCVRG